MIKLSKIGLTWNSSAYDFGAAGGPAVLASLGYLLIQVDKVGTDFHLRWGWPINMPGLIIKKSKPPEKPSLRVHYEIWSTLLWAKGYYNFRLVAQEREESA